MSSGASGVDKKRWWWYSTSSAQRRWLPYIWGDTLLLAPGERVCFWYDHLYNGQSVCSFSVQSNSSWENVLSMMVLLQMIVLLPCSIHSEDWVHLLLPLSLIGFAVNRVQEKRDKIKWSLSKQWPKTKRTTVDWSQVSSLNLLDSSEKVFFSYFQSQFQVATRPKQS